MTPDLIVRTSVILGVTWVVARGLTRASAATRHLLWHVAVVAVLVAPILNPLVPKLEILPSAILPSVGGVHTLSPVAPADTTRDQTQPSRSTVEPIDSRPPLTASLEGWLSFAPVGWWLGMSLIGLYFLTGHLRAGLLTRRSHEAPAAWQEETSRLAAHLGIHRDVSVRVLRESGTPLALGVLRASILLPPAAYEWDAQRRRGVMLHELAHVQRGDCRAQALAQAACAIYWFNPLAWMAARALRRERERACDAEVLRSGTPASRYAADLLDLARSVQDHRTPAGAVAMARPNELEGRLMAILADQVDCLPGRPTRWSIATLVVATSVITLGATSGGGSMPISELPTAATARRIIPHETPLLDRSRSRATVEQSVATLETSSDARARELAVKALLGAGDHATIGPLTKALRDPDSQVREKAALGLGLLSSPDVIEPLIAALRDPDSQVREKAAIGLALRRDARAIEPLIRAMSDADSQVREKAAIALGTSGDSRARPVLQLALTDPDPQVREKAVSGLTLLHTASAADTEVVRSGLRTIVNGLVGLMR